MFSGGRMVRMVRVVGVVGMVRVVVQVVRGQGRGQRGGRRGRAIARRRVRRGIWSTGVVRGGRRVRAAAVGQRRQDARAAPRHVVVPAIFVKLFFENIHKFRW